MKKTGITRPIDELGRIVLPKEMRSLLDITAGDRFEISTEGNTILLAKITKRCVFCGDNSAEFDFKDKKVCKNCLSEIKGS